MGTNNSDAPRTDADRAQLLHDVLADLSEFIDTLEIPWSHLDSMHVDGRVMTAHKLADLLLARLRVKEPSK